MFFYFLIVFLTFTREFSKYEILHLPDLLHSTRFIAKFFSRFFLLMTIILIRQYTLMCFKIDQIFSIRFQSLEKQIQARTCESFLALQSFLWQLWSWNKSSVTLAALGSIKTRRRYQCARKHFHLIFTWERILKRKLLHLQNRNRHCLKSLITWRNQNLLNVNSLFRV